MESFEESGLLHELLAALLGFHGDIFVDTPSGSFDDDVLDPDSCSVVIADAVTWIGKTEREILLGLLPLGYHCKAMEAFIESQPSTWAHHIRRVANPSIYLRALAAGLTELLDVYRLEVQDIMASLEQPQHAAVPTVATIQYRLAPYQDLFPVLHRLVCELTKANQSVEGKEQQQHQVSEQQQQGAGSGKLKAKAAMTCATVINALTRAAGSGAPALHDCMQRLLHHCNHMLLQQLASWMVHGMLLDPNQEFFIRAVQPGAAGQSQARQASRQAAGAAAAAAAAAAGSDGPAAASAAASAANAYDEWHYGFEVVEGALPRDLIDRALAEDICFVGRAMRLLRHPLSTQLAAGRELMPLQDRMGFAEAFAALQEEPQLRRPALERLVETMRSHVAALLWRLLVGRAGLASHLCAIKGYFLLGRGDFWQGFLEECHHLMQAPPRPQTMCAELMSAFTASGGRSTADSDPLFARFSVRYPTDDGDARVLKQVDVPGHGAAGSTSHGVPEYDAAWDPLLLGCRLEWPLGLLLTPDHTRKYNQLFALLLRLKRMQLALDDVWKDLRIMDRDLLRETGTRDRRMVQLLDLRNFMAHVITNLVVYMQTDVIEVNYSILEAKLSQCQDFSQLEHAHNVFVSTLLMQSFLTVRTLCLQLADLFKNVRELYLLVSRATCNAHALDWARIEAVRVAFSHHFTGLFTNLSSTRMLESFRAPQLKQLVMRLDYNEYYKQQTKGGKE